MEKKKKKSWWNRVDADLRAGLQKKSGPCINGSETEATSRLSDLALCTPPLEISDTESQNTFLKLSCTLKTLNEDRLQSTWRRRTAARSLTNQAKWSQTQNSIIYTPQKRSHSPLRNTSSSAFPARSRHSCRLQDRNREIIQYVTLQQGLIYFYIKHTHIN